MGCATSCEGCDLGVQFSQPRLLDVDIERTLHPPQNLQLCSDSLKMSAKFRVDVSILIRKLMCPALLRVQVLA